MKTRRWHSSIVTVFTLFILLLALTLAASPVYAQSSTNTTTYTTSTQTIYNPATYSTVTVDQYSTEIMAQMTGGSVVFDQTYTVAFSDPAVQAAVLTAESDLTAGGAASFTGPTLTTNLTTLLSTNTTEQQTAEPNPLIVTSAYVGPQTIMIGDNQSQSYFIVAGQVDYDTLITTTEDTAYTTTDTYLITQVYDLVGYPAGPAAVPEPCTMLLLGSGLAGLAAYRRFKKA